MCLKEYWLPKTSSRPGEDQYEAGRAHQELQARGTAYSQDLAEEWPNVQVRQRCA